MSKPQWVLMPVKLEGESFEESTVHFDPSLLRRAYDGAHFADAESAFLWLELLGVPDEDATF